MDPVFETRPPAAFGPVHTGTPRSREHSPSPAEADVHLSIILHEVRLDYRACLTAAMTFVRAWCEKAERGAVSISLSGMTDLQRLPCESLYLVDPWRTDNAAIGSRTRYR